MPPRHLLLPPRDADTCTPGTVVSFNVVDLFGSPIPDVRSNLSTLIVPGSVVLIISPTYALRELERNAVHLERLQGPGGYTFAPNVNMDDIGESFNLGLKEGFKFEVRKVEGMGDLD